MTFATLNTINELLTEELKRREKALDIIKAKQKKEYTIYDDMIDGKIDCTDEEITEAQKKCEFSRELFKKIYREYDKVKNALEDFNDHDWH